MDLDDAIKHCEEVAKKLEVERKQKYESLGEDRALFAEEENDCKECAEEHMQLARWLKDYKRLLEKESKPSSNGKIAYWMLRHRFYSEISGIRLNTYKCSDCGREIICKADELNNYPYCHCGAKMKETDQ